MLIKILLILILLLPSCNISSQRINYENWILDWEENFDSGVLDTTIWSKIPRGHNLWNQWMSSQSSCYEFKDNTIVLKALYNTLCPQDTAKYLTGGIWTKNKKGFNAGRIEVKVKLNGIKGAWPAIWLGVVKKEVPWPWYGEIDIMERYGNSSNIVQTIHSYYTLHVNKHDPINTKRTPFNSNDYNIFGVDILEECVVFHLNGVETFTYPRIQEIEQQEQFPFFQEWYLIVDMQLKGEVTNLPTEMQIDWIRHYQKKR